MYRFKLFFIVILHLIALIFAQRNDTLELYQKLVGNGMLHQFADLIDSDPSLSNTSCARDILVWKLSSLKERWALRMSDANAKFPTGIMTLNLNSFGAYDQCLGVKHELLDRQIKGKYCSAKLPLTGIFTAADNDINLFYQHYRKFTENINGRIANVDQYQRFAISIGICIPDSCSGKDIEIIIENFFKIFGVNTELPLVAVPETECYTSDPVKWTAANWAGLGVLIVFINLLLSSTLYDLFAQFYQKEKNKFHTFLSSFSVYTNTDRLTTINTKSGSLRCIHGIRVLSLFWIILGHRYSFSMVLPMVNTIDFIEWNNSFSSMFVLAGSVAVDTFFVLSGFLLAYVLFQQLDKNKSFNLPLYYSHRLIRLTPAFAAIIFFSTTLYTFIADGPLWALVYERGGRPCEEYWWSALLYIQNYVNPLDMCISQTWYLCIDVQLFILSPILIYPLMKNKKNGIGNMLIWTSISQITVIVLVFVNEWPAAAISFNEDQTDYTINYYNATHMRATPWLLGFAAGYNLQKLLKKNYKFNSAVATSLWIMSLATIAAVVFGLKPLQATSHMSSVEDSFYNAYARTGWSLALIWIIIACVLGHGGPINWFLSLRCWEILGRLSYSMYLLHPMVQLWISASTRTHVDFSHLSLIYLYFGDLIMTGLISYLWTITFESPFITLEKLAFYSDKPQVQPTDIENTERN